MSEVQSVIEDHKVNMAKKLIYLEYSEKGDLSAKSVDIDLCSLPRRHGLHPSEFLIALALLRHDYTLDMSPVSNISTECIRMIGEAIVRLDMALFKGEINRRTHDSLVSTLYEIAGETPHTDIPVEPRNPVDEVRLEKLLSQYLKPACDKIVAAASLIEAMGVPGEALLEGLAKELENIVSSIPEPLRRVRPEGRLADLVSLLRAVEAASRKEVEGGLEALASRCSRLGGVGNA